MFKKEYIFYIVFTCLILLITDLSVLLDLHYLRFVSSFILLTFIPGLLIIQILKLDYLETLKKLLLSVGLSLIFVISMGILTNSLGYSKPLVTTNVLIVFNLFLILLMVIGHIINPNSPIGAPFNDKVVKFNSYEKLSLIISILLFTFSICGTYLAKNLHNYILLYLMVFLVPLLVILISFANKKIRENICVTSLFFISLSLVIAYTLISNYIYGSDSHSEFYLFNMVLVTGKWKLFETLNYLKPLDSCLVISILPAVYELFSKAPYLTTFKLIYVLPLSLTPLSVYCIAKNYNKPIYAFLTAIVIISSISFYSQTEAYRTYMAVFFFSLAIMVFLSSDINDMKKKFLFIIFTVGIIISHYSTSYIFFSLLLLSVIILYFLRILPKIKSNVYNENFKNQLYESNGKKPFFTIGLTVLVFVMIFLWYSQITGGAFSMGIDYITSTLGKLNQFFLLESRDPVAYQALGSTLSNASFIRYINFITSWALIISIAVGILLTFFFFLNNDLKKKLHLSNIYCNIKMELFTFGVSSFLIMAAAVILPFFLVFYSLPRLYYLLLIILSLFFILGTRSIANILKIKRGYILVLIVLIPILLSSIGITPQFFGEPNSILLNPADKINNTFYIHDTEAHGAQWLGNYRNDDMKIYTDSIASERLISIGRIPNEDILNKNNIEQFKHTQKGYTYLAYPNIAQGKLYLWEYSSIWNLIDIKELSNVFDEENLIYDDGDCKILQY